MASGDTKTQQYLDVAANGTRADLPSDTCCETRTQTLIRGVAERIMDVEDEVERLENNPDVVDIVATYAALQAYPTSQLTDKDVVRVLQDETHDGDSTYYRWSTTTQTWTYIGESKQYTDFVGTDGTAGGQNGLVPAPVATDAGKFLNANGSWEEVQAGATYTAGEGIDITNDVISATNTGKAKVLTTADYNYHSSGSSDDGIAWWLLEPGIYTTEVAANVYANKLQFFSKGALGALIVSRTSNQGYKTLLQTDTNPSGSKLRIITVVASNGTEIQFANGLKDTDIIDNLTSSSSNTPLSANQGRILKNLVDSIAIRGTGAPTASTVGTVGQLYEDGTNGALYQLKSIDITVTPNTYNWEQVGGSSAGAVTTLTAADYNWPTTGTPTEVALWLLEPGMYSVGSGVSARFNTTEYFSRGLAIVTPKDSAGYTGILQIDSQGIGASAQGKLYSVTPSGGNAYSPSVFPLTLVQTTGASSTTVMSQNAVTKMVFNDPDRKTQIRISGNGDESISLGSLAHASTLAIAIGAKSSMVPGNGASATGTGSIAIGANITGPNGHPWAAGAYSIAIGSQTYAEQNSVAIGYGANATQQGQVDISTGALTTAGYNNSNYRLLTGLYDPQNAHDAANKEYVDGLISALEARIAALEGN